MAKQKVSANDVIFNSVWNGTLACGICLLLFLPAAMLIKAGIADESAGPFLVAVCALSGGILSGIILGIGKKGGGAAALLSTAVSTLILMIISAGIKKTGQLPLFGIVPFSGAYFVGFLLSSIMQNNKKDRRSKK